MFFQQNNYLNMAIYRTVVFSLIYLFTSGCTFNEQQKNNPSDLSSPSYNSLGFLEKIDPAFDQWVPPQTKIMIIDSGYTWTEGTLWVPSENALLFSDVPKNIAYKWTEGKPTEEFLNPSGYDGPLEHQNGSNGLTLDHSGDLMICQNGNRAVAKLKGSIKDNNGECEMVATHFNGKRFNSCNDLVIDREGNIYFTDPNFGLDLQYKELEFQGVYRITPAGEIQLLTSKWPTPNGIGLSPDEKTLYISNSEPGKLIAYDFTEQNQLTNERILLDLEPFWEKSIAKQRPDGMDINKSGIIFLTGPDGVFVIQPDGKHLGTIRTDKLTANCTFNEEETTLFIACHQLLLKVDLN